MKAERGERVCQGGVGFARTVGKEHGGKTEERPGPGALEWVFTDLDGKAVTRLPGAGLPEGGREEMMLRDEGRRDEADIAVASTQNPWLGCVERPVPSVGATHNCPSCTAAI